MLAAPATAACAGPLSLARGIVADAPIAAPDKAVPAFSICGADRLGAWRRRLGIAGTPRAVAVVIAIGWLPLLVLSALNGTAFDGSSHPFIAEPGPWVRFFVVVPLLILTEKRADWLLGMVVDSFRRSGIVRGADIPAYDAAVARCVRSAGSARAELALLLVALAVPFGILTSLLPLVAGAGGWYGGTADGARQLSAAGRWYEFVSLPLVQFLLLRWFWRLYSWFRFLWRVSRFDLALAPAHADRAGGLGFVSFGPLAFLPVMVALSSVASVGIARQILSAGASLADFRVAIVAIAVGEVLLLVTPHLFFVVAAVRARRQALLTYGVAEAAMTRAFARDMTGPADAQGAALLESQHPSAMIDFASTYQLIQVMQPLGINSLRQVLVLVGPVLVPFAPLLLFEHSLSEIFKQVLSLLR